MALLRASASVPQRQTGQHAREECAALPRVAPRIFVPGTAIGGSASLTLRVALRSVRALSLRTQPLEKRG
eukprot:scaffold295_cov257-Pinguiococcus_pyrenoidosus.AAC.8